MRGVTVKISEKGLNLIKEYEGLKLRAYQCSARVWTIGYGHTNGVKPGDVIDIQQASLLLTEDVSSSEKTVNQYVKAPLAQHQFDALVSFVFNLGAGNFRRSTMLKKINALDYSGAVEEFSRWVYSGGKKSPGLERRRQAEKIIFTSIN